MRYTFARVIKCVLIKPCYTIYVRAFESPLEVFSVKIVVHAIKNINFPLPMIPTML